MNKRIPQTQNVMGHVGAAPKMFVHERKEGRERKAGMTLLLCYINGADAQTDEAVATCLRDSSPIVSKRKGVLSQQAVVLRCPGEGGALALYLGIWFLVIQAPQP